MASNPSNNWEASLSGGGPSPRNEGGSPTTPTGPSGSPGLTGRTEVSASHREQTGRHSNPAQPQPAQPQGQHIAQPAQPQGQPNAPAPQGRHSNPVQQSHNAPHPRRDTESSQVTPFIAPLAEDPTAQALAFRGLVKQFDGNKAVDHLNLDIPRGSFYGLVGPNGAGKTTAITMATGLLRPDDGRVWVAGHDVWLEPSAAKACFGLLADGLPVFDRLSGKELLQFSGALRGMDERTVETRANELLRVLDLEESANKLVTDYSAGMTKKILLAQALIHRPEILILDEPLEAVDPVSSQIIREILRAYVKAGGTVIMSSHVMELVEGLCDHVAIMKAGRVLSCGTTEQVRGSFGSLTEAFLTLVGGGTLAAGSLGWLAQ